VKRCVPILLFGFLALTLATHGARAQVQGVNSITNNNLVLGAGNNAFMVIGTSGAISIGTSSAYPLSVGTSTALNGYLNITTGGNVGIGTMEPTAALDVNGGIRGSNVSSIVAGSACSPEGMMGYDLTNHQAVYCSSSGKWAAFSAFRTSCPAGYTLIGTSGTAEAYCVESASIQTFVSWDVAASNCYSAGAHICSVSEWYDACVSGLVPGGAHPIGQQWEWVAVVDSLTPGSSNYGVAMGNGSCAGSSMAPAPSLPYRCCMR
jgi:hypothetical protein